LELKNLNASLKMHVSVLGNQIALFIIMVLMPRWYQEEPVYDSRSEGVATALGIRQEGTMKRSRQEIFSQILDICMNGANKTRIVYQANLNFRTVNPYLDILIKNQHLIETGQGDQILYQTTQKGMDLLESINKVNSTLFPK
jgi:predicted transcriptional regulator